MFKQLFIATTLFSSLAMFGCVTTINPATDRNLNKLQNKNWVVSQIGDVKFEPDQTKSNVPSIQFTSTEMTGFDGCNYFKAGYVVKAKEIQITPTSTTAKACIDSTNAIGKFHTSLLQAVSYEATSKYLNLLNKEQKVVLQFVDKSPK